MYHRAPQRTASRRGPALKRVRWARTADDFAAHRVGFPDALFDRLDAFGVGRAGQRLLDIGTGTGVLARAYARRGCQVTGIDASAELIAEARRLDANAGVDVDYVVGKAEDIELPDASFDVVTAGNAWHWLDGELMALEARRLLVTDGLLVITNFDWLARRGNVVEMTERLIEAHYPEWPFVARAGFYPRALFNVTDAGYADIESFTFDVVVTYDHAGWRGRVRASAGVGASLSAEAVAAFDDDLARLLTERFPAEPLEVPHRSFTIVCRSPFNPGD